ncbi:MAG: histidine kinase [Bacteroidales bacterium]|nr:histidine kinase [Bacteroidales bacterium]MCF8457734.1 histidine kinase [Bacteroidales bacterium]
MGKKLFILQLFILVALSVVGQDYFYKNFTKEDGLPGSEVYDLIQDLDGYIWMATSYGVCRYDGYEFRTFTTDDGLADNSTITLSLDKKGRIWASSYSGDISWYENGKFHAHPLNDELQKYTQGFVELFFDSAGNIYFTSLANRTIGVKVTPDNKIVLDKSIKSDSVNHDYNLRFTPTSFGILISGWETTDDDRFNQTVLNKKEDTFHLKYPENYKGFFFKYCKICDGEFLLSSNNWLFHIKDDKIVAKKKYNSRVNDIFVDDRMDFWISIENEGLFLYKERDIACESHVFFPGMGISNIIQDKEKNYWVSTNGQGVFVIPSMQIQYMNNPAIKNSKIVALRVFQDSIYFSTWDKKMYRFHPSSSNIERIDQSIFKDHPEVCNDLLIDSLGSLWALGSQGLCVSKNLSTGILSFKESGYFLAELEDKRIAVASYFGLIIFDDYNQIQYSQKEGNTIRSRTLYNDSKGALWIGSLDGLYKYDNGAYTYLGNNYPALSERITAICGNDSLLFVGTRGSGIVIARDATYYAIGEADGVRANNVQSLFLENDSCLWIGTNSGLSRLRFHFSDSFQFSAINFTIWDGLPSNNITRIIKVKENIYLGTEKGIAFFNPDSISVNHTHPSIKIENVRINERDTLVCDSYTLKHFQRNLKISFKGLHFKSIGNINYKYKLFGLSDKWTYTNNTEVEYAMVPQGEYRFVVYAQNLNGYWSEAPATVSFVIEKPFWKHIWFLILTGLFVLVLALLIVVAVIRNINKKNQREQDLIQYHQQALSKQLNPHFLYNSLNSIQRFILENDKISSSEYLSKFSKLMRIILEMSNKPLVTLQDEIDSLHLYLELESLRLKDSFHYRIDVDEDIKKDETKLPSFMIQPFVENSIWHGLMTIEAEKKLEISFSKRNSGLICQVRDNGIGRKKSNEIKERQGSKNKRSPYGIKTTQTRLDLYNKQYNTSSSIKIIDLTNEEEEPEGTLVEIYFLEYSQA